MNDERGQKAVALGPQKGRPRNDDVHFQREGNQRWASGTRSSRKTCRAQAAPPWGRAGAAQAPGRQRATEVLWALPHLECRPRSAPGSDVPPGPKTQLSRLSNSSFFSQMQTCPKAGRSLPCSLPHLECYPVGYSCIAHNRFYKAVVLPGSFEK